MPAPSRWRWPSTAIEKGEEKQLAIVATLEKAKALCPCRDDLALQQFINDALPFKATGQLVTAIRSALGQTDEMAEKVLLKPLEPDFDRATVQADPGTWYQTDGSLRDEERIPLKIDIDTHFAKEVLPYAPDTQVGTFQPENPTGPASFSTCRPRSPVRLTTFY